MLCHILTPNGLDVFHHKQGALHAADASAINVAVFGVRYFHTHSQVVSKLSRFGFQQLFFLDGWYVKEKGGEHMALSQAELRKSAFRTGGLGLRFVRLGRPTPS